MVLDLKWALLAATLLAFAAGDAELSSAQTGATAAWRSGVAGSASANTCKKKRRRSSKRRKAKRSRKSAPTPKPSPAAPPTSSLVPNTQFSGPTRIDFDDRLIQGQTNKSGAVYLFDRKESGISSMVKRRKSFRQLTIRTVYDR